MTHARFPSTYPSPTAAEPLPLSRFPCSPPVPGYAPGRCHDRHRALPPPPASPDDKHSGTTFLAPACPRRCALPHPRFHDPLRFAPDASGVPPTHQGFPYQGRYSGPTGPTQRLVQPASPRLAPLAETAGTIVPPEPFEFSGHICVAHPALEIE